MKINELEKRFGIKRANIRFYESEGLLQPQRSENGYRNYTEEDAARLKKIIVYRRLGISIPDIKKVLAGELSLQTALDNSLEAMTEEIDKVSKTVDIFEELKEKNVTDAAFNTDDYWERLQETGCDAPEPRFVNVDVSGFRHQKKANTAVLIFTVMFVLGIVWAFFTNAVFLMDNNENYTKTGAEIKTSDTIDTVKINPGLNRLYVFYEEACAVNTYDLDGNFLWSVSTPFRRERGLPYFYADGDRIVLDYKNDCYFYQAADGAFIKVLPVEEAGYLEAREHWQELHDADKAALNAAGYDFDFFNVYKRDGSGKAEKRIVDKPFFLFLLNPTTGVLLAAFGAVGIAAIMVINHYKKLKKIQVLQNEVGRAAKAHRVVLSAVLGITVLFILLNLLLSFAGIAHIGVGIFPLTLLFIGMIIMNDMMKKRYNASEKKVTGTVFHYLILAFIAMLLSVAASLLF